MMKHTRHIKLNGKIIAGKEYLIILGILALILFLSFVSSILINNLSGNTAENITFSSSTVNYCFQESANVSTTCGGLSTGNYSSNGALINVNYGYDGDYETFTAGNETTNGTLFINYSKPTNVDRMSLWQVNDCGYANLTITDSCWSQSVLQLRARSETDVYTRWDCYNGSWVNLRSVDCGYITEEAMYWSKGINRNLSISKYVNVTSATINLSEYINNWNDKIDVYNASLGGYNFSSQLWAVSGYGDLYFDKCTFSCSYLFIKDYYMGLANGWSQPTSTQPNCFGISYSRANTQWNINDYICVNDSLGNIKLLQMNINSSPATSGTPFNFSWINYYGNTINPYVSINNTHIWNFSGTFNQTNNKTNDFASTLNTAINNGKCNCVGCSLVGNNCSLNFTFHSSSAGILQYSDIQINYDPIPFVYLKSPNNATYSSFNKTFTCNSTDEINLKNITLYIWNSTSIYNNSNSVSITGISNSTIFNPINFSRSDNYTWNCLAFNNGSYSNWYESNYTLIVDVSVPVTTLNYPSNNLWLNNGTNVNFNCTTEGDNLDSQFFYGNFTGTYGLNQTKLGITSGSINTYLLNLSDNQYSWTCAANKSTDSTIVFSQYGNYTLGIDTVFPLVNITKITPTTGSSIVTFNSTETDTNLASCKYTVYNSLGNVDSVNNNVSFICNIQKSIIVFSGYGNYNLTIYANDSAGNENSSTKSFTTSESSVTPGGGGGTPVPEEKEPETFCGDNICQGTQTGFLLGNDKGLNENFWSCNIDCPQSFDFDQLFYMFWKNCLDDLPETICIWSQGFGREESSVNCGDNICDRSENAFTCESDCGSFNVNYITNCVTGDGACFFASNMFWYIFFGLTGIVLILSLIQINTTQGKKNIGGYIVLKTKKRFKRYRRRY